MALEETPKLFYAECVMDRSKGEGLNIRSFSLGPFRAACQMRVSWDCPRETESGPKTSPLARLAAETVALGRPRATWRMRVPWNAPRETESAPNPSPLGCLAAKTVALGALHATRVMERFEGERLDPRACLPRGTWNPPPRHLLAFEFTR